MDENSTDPTSAVRNTSLLEISALPTRYRYKADELLLTGEDVHTLGGSCMWVSAEVPDMTRDEIAGIEAAADEVRIARQCLRRH